MTWVTCQLTSGRTRAVNADLVKYADEKDTSTVLHFIDGDAIVVMGPMSQWLNNIETSRSE